MREMTSSDPTRLHGRNLYRPWGRMRIWETGATSGAHAPILALHGLGGSGRYWAGLAKVIGGGTALIAPDLAGFGSSDEPAEHATRDLHLADLDALMDDVVPDGGPITVIGFSAGATRAALWAARNAGRVARLVLAGAPFPGDGGMDFRHHTLNDLPFPRQVLFKGARAAWPLLAFPVSAVSRFPLPIVQDFGKQSMPARTWTLWSVVSDPEVPGELEPLQALAARAPVLLMNAADDRTVPLHHQTEWSELVPGARCMVVPKGRHQFLLRGGWRPLAEWLDTTAPTPD
jgi:pimeloyl-ACP methyl ester carboxylesterase